MPPSNLDLVVVGAGPAGLVAAAEVARHGGRVVVLDEAPFPGGRLPAQIHPEHGLHRKAWFNGASRAKALLINAEKNGARIHCGASVWGIFPGWHVEVSPTVPESEKNKWAAGLDAKAVLIAAGASQNPLMIPGWNLPGVITAGAAQILINIHRVLPGRQVSIIGVDPLSLSVAQMLAALGVQVVGVFLPPPYGFHFGSGTPREAIKTLSRLSAYASNRTFAMISRLSGGLSSLAARFYPLGGISVSGFRLCLRQAVLTIGGKDSPERVFVSKLDPRGRVCPNDMEEWPTDVVITSAGLSPLVELLQVAGCPLAYQEGLGGWVPVHNQRMETPLEGLFVAGSITGIEGSSVAEAQGLLAGLAVMKYLRLTKKPLIENEILESQKAVNAARKKSLAFLPDLQKCRDDFYSHSIDSFCNV